MPIRVKAKYITSVIILKYAKTTKKTKKENIEKEGKIYIGNAKKFERQEPKPLDPNNVNDITEPLDDLPFWKETSEQSFVRILGSHKTELELLVAHEKQQRRLNAK